MELNHNSISARLYRWFYGTDNMPNSLCTYFWKWLFMWITVIPLGIFSLPSLIIEPTKNNDYHIGVRAFMSCLVYFAIYLLFSLLISVSLFWWVGEPESFAANSQFLGAVLWAMLLICGLRWLILYIRDVVFYSSTNNSDKSNNVVSEFVKAKVNKVCPRLIWKK